MEQSSPSLSRYAGIFGLSYFALIIAIPVLLYGLGIELHTGMNMGILFGAGFISTHKFLSDNNRPPTKSERRKLALTSTLLCFLISLVAAGIIIQIAGGAELWAEVRRIFSLLSPLIWGLIVLATAAMYYLLLIFIYGWGANMLYRHKKK